MIGLAEAGQERQLIGAGLLQQRSHESVLVAEGEYQHARTEPMASAGKVPVYVGSSSADVAYAGSITVK
ncbi:hypothetical protein [Streptomyces sp. NPDC005141]